MHYFDGFHVLTFSSEDSHSRHLFFFSPFKSGESLALSTAVRDVSLGARPKHASGELRGYSSMTALI